MFKQKQEKAPPSRGVTIIMEKSPEKPSKKKTLLKIKVKKRKEEDEGQEYESKSKLRVVDE